jgi:FkbM family methyltransferase
MIQKLANHFATSLGHHSKLIRAFRPAYERTLNALNLGRGIPWSLNGVPFRIDARFRSAMGKNYDSEIAAFLKGKVAPGAVCFDVGANLGVYVLQFAEWSKPNGTVVAFEPNPSTAAALRRHIAMNQLAHRVRVVDQAVSDRAGSAEFFAAGCDGMSRLGTPNRLISDRVQKVSVPTTTLDGFVKQSGVAPDVMLIDVEGFEIPVLRGARQVLANHPEMLLIVEMHPNVWESAGTTREQAISVVRELNLDMVALAGQRDPLGEHGPVLLTASTRTTTSGTRGLSQTRR